MSVAIVCMINNTALKVNTKSSSNVTSITVNTTNSSSTINQTFTEEITDNCFFKEAAHHSV